jgi:hypothetical protein
MFDDILVLMSARPFEPFTMHLTSGAAIAVPTVDHISVLHHAKRILVDNDDGRTYHIIRPEQIAHCSVDGQPA